MEQDEIIEMARDLTEEFGSRMCDENGDTHGEELYAMGVDDIIDIIKLVDAKATAKEREACIVDIQMHIPRSGRDTLEYKMAMRMIERIKARGAA